jgi:hypothetical protein
MPMSSIGILYDHHVDRIRRIVEQEFSGCSAIFDQSAWPLFQFHVQDARGTILLRQRPLSLAELERLTDDKLRAAIVRQLHQSK